MEDGTVHVNDYYSNVFVFSKTCGFHNLIKKSE